MVFKIVYLNAWKQSVRTKHVACTDKTNTVSCGWRLYHYSPLHGYMTCTETFFLLFKNFNAKYFKSNLEGVKFFISSSSMTALSARMPQNGGPPKQLRLIPAVLSQFCRLYSDQKVSVHLSFLPHYLAQSDCLAADRQGQGDTRLTLTPSVISNSNYAIMVRDWNSLKYF
jgi:hypothetical protein